MKRIEKDYSPGEKFTPPIHDTIFLDDNPEEQVLAGTHRKPVELSLEDINDILAMTDEVLIIPSSN